jgi:glycosyltransferase involved in cell wall biosynthesis
MAYDLPIITTRWRMIPDLFPKGYGGLVRPQAPDEVAAALRQFLREGPPCEFRKQFLAQFTETIFAERMSNALHQLACPL